MKFFKKYFTEVENWEQEEIKVLCPFHNDVNPSASINTEKSLFHCWVCDVGYNEEQFVARVNNISSSEAYKLIDRYNQDNNWNYNVGVLWSDGQMLEKLNNLGITKDTINELKLGLIKEDIRKFIGIPVFYNGMLVDVRKYNIMKYSGCPKEQSLEGAQSGWVVPYDKFIQSNEPCYFFEGEKDMMMAREIGINAYTMISGAGATPNQYTINSFKNKEIILCYDNDEAGTKGMSSMYNVVKDLVKSVKYIKIGDVVKEEKEDFYDYINKYNGNIFEFYTLEQHHFNLEEKEDYRDLITIKSALSETKTKQELRSIVTITSEFTDSYSVPSIVKFKKEFDGGKGTKNDMMIDEERLWVLEDKNINEFLELMEVSAKDTDVLNKLKSFVGISPKEVGLSVKTKEPKTIFRSIITDTETEGASNISIDLYSFEKLEVGSQYIVTYKLFPHPNKNQKLVAIAKESKLVHDNKNYKVDKEKLSKFKVNGTVKERLDYLYQSMKHYVAKHLKYDTWLMTDLVFNSILDFKYGEVMKGTLDVFFLGDTRTGKSETTSKIRDVYNFGHFLSLKTATTVGLIGGANKIDGSYCNTIGAIPRQNKGLVILEEFSGARPDFIKTMTDIRSSNELRLARVSGEFSVPCKLRMITISNPLNDDNGNPRFLNTFPNGVMPIMELIKSAEDVARYDGFLLISKIEDRFNPFEFRLEGEPIPKECYEDKMDWVTTRKVENIIFAEGVESYIWEKAEELNKLFECNFPLFDVTTHIKLARFCVALASLIVNTDESYENIIVTKEIVDYMVEWLKSIYNNDIFKLRDYTIDYRAYNVFNDKDIENLQSVYANNSTLIDFIAEQNKTTRGNLMSISGVQADKFAPIFNSLVGNKFVRINGDMVYPTDKFRKVYKLINRDFRTDIGNKVANATPTQSVQLV